MRSDRRRHTCTRARNSTHKGRPVDVMAAVGLALGFVFSGGVGFAAGTLGAGVPALLGPRVADIVSYEISASALAAASTACVVVAVPLARQTLHGPRKVTAGHLLGILGDCALLGFGGGYALARAFMFAGALLP